MDLRGITGWLQTNLFGPDEAPAPKPKVPRSRKIKPVVETPPVAVDFPRPPTIEGQPIAQAVAPASFRHPQANREVRLGDAQVAYVFSRAKRRTIGFLVGPEGLEVRAPRWTPVFEVEAALQEKAKWIMRKLDETRARKTRQDDAQIVWQDGARLPFLGGSITLALDPSHAFKAIGCDIDALPVGADPAQFHRTLRVSLPLSATEVQIRHAVQAWLMRQAQANFKQRLDHFAPLLQVQWRRLSLSSANTRWGSAGSDGSIRLNWRLIHFRQDIIDYVVAHELSHLRVMDHSPRFWDTVSTVVPDHKTLRAQLKDDAIPRW